MDYNYRERNSLSSDNQLIDNLVKGLFIAGLSIIAISVLLKVFNVI